ncbi:MAG: ATP phosphoribosyltransferase regulatory subunit [Clostridia bacterium]|nr:ATP phosphoribosyltransferase regulatory subunit [Clostridia bacterium]
MKDLQLTCLREDEKATLRLRALFARYGYRPYRMSKFEEYDLYVRNKSFLLSDHVITFTDTDGKLMALKPDVTLSIVKNSKASEGGLEKVFYNENVYRVSRGGEAFREIMQVGAECIGEIDEYGLCEVLLLAAKSLETLSDSFVLDLSHMGILAAVLDGLGLTDAARAELLVCIGDKNLHTAREICRREGVSPEGEAALELLITSYGEPSRVLPLLRKGLPKESCGALLDQLERILDALSPAIPEGRLHVDFSVIHDCRYYNGLVFKGFIEGIPTGILSGGQYDALMQRMGKRAGGVGFAVYLDLLEELAKPRTDYDVDAVLLYGEEDPPAKVASAVERLSADGKSVRAQRGLQEDQRYRELWRLQGEEVTLLEADA